MRDLSSRFSQWILVHPAWWAAGSGIVLVLLGFALNLAPIVVIAAGATGGVLNILHARRRCYCRGRPSGLATSHQPPAEGE
jgi:hypothetical protein